MAREIFPEHPLKYMPPTKYMTGDVFQGLVMDTMFNFVSQATGQGIHLLGMLTEAIHTPFMQDRFLGLENAQYVMNTWPTFADEVEFRQGGIVARRAPGRCSTRRWRSWRRSRPPACSTRSSKACSPT